MFAARMGLQAYALAAAAQGAVDAYAHVTGEDWKAYEPPAAAPSSVSRKSSAEEMAAFGWPTQAVDRKAPATLPLTWMTWRRTMQHYPGYITNLDFLEDEELSLELLKAQRECDRGCLDMEGMSARVEAIRSELFDRTHP